MIVHKRFFLLFIFCFHVINAEPASDKMAGDKATVPLFSLKPLKQTCGSLYRVLFTTRCTKKEQQEMAARLKKTVFYTVGIGGGGYGAYRLWCIGNKVEKNLENIDHFTSKLADLDIGAQVIAMRSTLEKTHATLEKIDIAVPQLIKTLTKINGAADEIVVVGGSLNQSLQDIKPHLVETMENMKQTIFQCERALAEVTHGAAQLAPTAQKLQQTLQELQPSILMIERIVKEVDTGLTVPKLTAAVAELQRTAHTLTQTVLLFKKSGFEWSMYNGYARLKERGSDVGPAPIPVAKPVTSLSSASAPAPAHTTTTSSTTMFLEEDDVFVTPPSEDSKEE